MNKQVTHIKAVDGSTTAIAPEPRRGLVKLVYQVVKELGGATEEQIKKYLPAVSDKSDLWINKKKFDACLYSGVYSGYLITDGNYYRIAPYSYYEARQEMVAVSPPTKTKDKQSKVRKHPAPDQITYIRPLWHWVLLVNVGVITTVAGFVIGLLVGLSHTV